MKLGNHIEDGISHTHIRVMYWGIQGHNIGGNFKTVLEVQEIAKAIHNNDKGSFSIKEKETKTPHPWRKS